MSISARYFRVLLTLSLALAAGAPSPVSAQAQTAGATASAPPGLIVGRVIDSSTKKPVPEAIVVLRQSIGGPALDQRLTTAGGEFYFADVPIGTWILTTTRPGYQGIIDQRITLTAGDRATQFDVVLSKFAALSGVVTDDRGRPEAGVTVRSFIRDARGYWGQSVTASTDDRGEFRFHSLLPRAYAIGVQANQWLLRVASSAPGSARVTSGSDVESATLQRLLPGSALTLDAGGTGLVQRLDTVGRPPFADSTGRLHLFPAVFFGGSFTIAGATVVSMTPGEERTGANITLRSVPAFRVEGTLTGAGANVSNLQVRVVPADGGGFASDLPVAITVSDAAGRFVIPAVAAGRYRLEATRRPRTTADAEMQTAVVESGGAQSSLGGNVPYADQLAAPADDWWWGSVEVGVDRDLRDVALTLARGVRLSGRVEFEGTSARSSNSVRPPPVAIWGATHREAAYFTAPTKPDWTFVSPSIPPGTYTLDFASLNNFRPTRIVVNGRDVIDDVLSVGDADITDVVVTMSDAMPSLTGTVRLADGRPAAETPVYVFTTDTTSWPRVIRSPRRMRTIRTSSNGTYSIPGMLPGEYFVVAIADAPEQHWQTPSNLQAWSALATRVTIGDATATADVVLRPAPRAGGDDEPSDHVGGPFVPDETADQTRDQGMAPRGAATPAAASDGRGSIVGVVRTDDTAAAPIPRAIVTVNGANGAVARTTIADDDGAFVFGGLPDGHYRVAASKVAYLPIEYGAKRSGRPGVSVPVEKSARVSLTLKLPRAGAIAGEVRDTAGRPMVSVQVYVLALENAAGQPTLRNRSTLETYTDDRGRYRMYGLPPGEYHVAVRPANPIGVTRVTEDELKWARAQIAAGGRATTPPRPPKPAQPMTFGAAFHPSGATLAGARSVRVDRGSDTTGIDIVVAFAPVTSIAGTIVGLDGRPLAGQVSVLPAGVSLPVDTQRQGLPGSGNATSLGGAVTVRTTPAGAFVVDGLATGPYTVFARAAGPDKRTLWAVQPIVAGEAAVRDVTIPLQQPLEIAGSVARGDTDAAMDLSRVRIGATPIVSSDVSVTVPSVPVDAHGRFTISGLIPGRYRISVTGLPGSTMVAGIDASGRSVADTGVNVEPGAAPIAVAITLTSRVTAITGTFTDTSGRPASDYYVVAFSDDQSHWERGSTRIRATRPATDGRFSFTALPPGRYRLGVVSDVEPDEWFDRTFLEALQPSTVVVDIAAGDRKTQDIRIAAGTPR